MAKLSAGIMLYRWAGKQLEVLLVHPGGPFWARKDEGVWSIPKGEYEPADDAWLAAVREFEEELGTAPPPGPGLQLGTVKLASGKVITAWALEGDLDVTNVVSNTFEIEWPRASGRMRAFPEVDRAAWLTGDEVRRLLHPRQLPLHERLLTTLGAS